MCALSGLEQACWDLKSKALGVTLDEDVLARFGVEA